MTLPGEPSAIEAAPTAHQDCRIVLRALVVIQDQIAELRSCDRLLQLAREMRDARTFDLVGRRLAGAVKLLASSYARIRRPILDFDHARFGRPESFGELGVRGQMSIVELQLRRLEARLARPCNAQCSALATGLPAVAEVLRVELALATALWAPYRKARWATEDTISSVITDEQRVRRYHAEILAAEERLYALASEPRVESFLFAGTACTESAEVQAAGAMIHRALQLRVTGVSYPVARSAAVSGPPARPRRRGADATQAEAIAGCAATQDVRVSLLPGGATSAFHFSVSRSCSPGGERGRGHFQTKELWMVDERRVGKRSAPSSARESTSIDARNVDEEPTLGVARVIVGPHARVRRHGGASHRRCPMHARQERQPRA